MCRKSKVRMVMVVVRESLLFANKIITVHFIFPKFALTASRNYSASSRTFDETISSAKNFSYSSQTFLTKNFCQNSSTLHENISAKQTFLVKLFVGSRFSPHFVSQKFTVSKFQSFQNLSEENLICWFVGLREKFSAG